MKRRMIGPFVFLDQMGPTVLRPGKALDVRPHPHIGLATVTWILDGEIMHRDSLGSVQPIKAGELNWMTAGRGIVHSERTPDRLRGEESPLYGLQLWVALPKAHEETEPGFVHYGADELPRLDTAGAKVKLIVGVGWGTRSPVETLWGTFFADASLKAGATLTVPSNIEERGVYILEGELEIAGEAFAPGQLMVLKRGRDADVRARQNARFVIVGGDAIDGPRHIWWNFVSSSKERIEQAKADWKAGRFPAVPGETDFIPLPD
jgi:redox-sensitive bicupin YhaK (pirin superfamily)